MYVVEIVSCTDLHASYFQSDLVVTLRTCYGAL